MNTARMQVRVNLYVYVNQTVYCMSTWCHKCQKYRPFIYIFRNIHYHTLLLLMLDFSNPVYQHFWLMSLPSSLLPLTFLVKYYFSVTVLNLQYQPFHWTFYKMYGVWTKFEFFPCGTRKVCINCRSSTEQLWRGWWWGYMKQCTVHNKCVHTVSNIAKIIILG